MTILYKLTQAPTVQCIDSDSLKLYLRIDDASAVEEDDLLNDLIWSAIYQAQDFCGVAFNTQKYCYKVQPTRPYVILPWVPLITVDSIYLVYQGTKTLVPAENYVVDTPYGVQGMVMLKAGMSWLYPYLSATAWGEADHIEINYTSGYGPKAADVPAPIRNAVKIIAASQYDDRTSGMPESAKLLLRPYRMDDEDYTMNWR